MSYNPVARWNKSDSSNVNQYTVQWTLNGSPVGSTTIAQSAGQDASGYMSLFGNVNPTITLHANDMVGVIVTAVDVIDGLSSSPTSAGPLTIPASPPDPPAGLTLTLT